MRMRKLYGNGILQMQIERCEWCPNMVIVKRFGKDVKVCSQLTRHCQETGRQESIEITKEPGLFLADCPLPSVSPQY